MSSLSTCLHTDSRPVDSVKQNQDATIHASSWCFITAHHYVLWVSLRSLSLHCYYCCCLIATYSFDCEYLMSSSRYFSTFKSTLTYLVDPLSFVLAYCHFGWSSSLSDVLCVDASSCQKKDSKFAIGSYFHFKPKVFMMMRGFVVYQSTRML